MDQAGVMEPYLPTNPLFRFVVSEERNAKSLEALQKGIKGLTQEQLIDCMFEIGYGDAVEPILGGADMIDILTPLQLCTLSVALMVAAESRGQMELDPRRGRS